MTSHTRIALGAPAAVEVAPARIGEPGVLLEIVPRPAQAAEAAGAS